MQTTIVTNGTRHINNLFLTDFGDNNNNSRTTLHYYQLRCLSEKTILGTAPRKINQFN